MVLIVGRVTCVASLVIGPVPLGDQHPARLVDILELNIRELTSLGSRGLSTAIGADDIITESIGGVVVLTGVWKVSGVL